MSENYTFDPNDLIPDRELEIKFESLTERTSKKGNTYLLVKMIVRDDIGENSVYKNKVILDYINRLKGQARYPQWKLESLMKTQDLSQLQASPTQPVNMNLEQIKVFLVGKNARVKIALKQDDVYGAKNVIEEYKKSNYIPIVKKELPKPQAQEEDDIFIDDDDLLPWER